MVLSYEEKKELRKQEQQKAKDEILENFSKYGKTLVVRPTGFGKTFTLVDLGKEYAVKTGKKILYVYPINIIPDSIKTDKMYMTDYIMPDGQIIWNDIDIQYARQNKIKLKKTSLIKDYFDFVSYALLTKRYNELGEQYWREEIQDKYCLIMLDEAHRAGSNGFMKIYENVSDLIGVDGIHMLGVTATPDRMMDTDDCNILNSIFDNIQISEFTLGDAIRTGLMSEITYGLRVYDIEILDEAKKIKTEMKEKCINTGHSFNEDSFNIAIAKALEENGDEAKFIWDFIKEAGYTLKDSDDTYFKFIVFFRDKEDLASKGPLVAEWFNGAFNRVAKKELGLRKDYTINSYYVASGDTEEGDFESIVNEDKEHRKFLKRTNKLSDLLEKKKRTVDLLLTIDMINMGYHADDVTGIVMLRGTKSKIVYYQQLGRCLSIRSEKSPIVLDFVNNYNEKHYLKRESKQRFNESVQDLANLLNNQGISEYNNSGERDGKNRPNDIKIINTGNLQVRLFEEIEKYLDVSYSDNERIKWMYVDRMTPLCVIASDLKLPMSEVVNKLIEMNISLRAEDAMYQFISKKAKADVNSNEHKLIKYIFSNHAKQFLNSIGNTSKTIFDVLKALVKKQ